MSIITSTTLVAKAPLQPLLNFGKLNFPNNEKRYFTGKGAYKSVMLAEVYFYTNSSNQQKIKYKPIIRTTPILGCQVEGQNFQLETGAVIKFGTTWDSFIINPGAYGMEFEEITKEEYNTYVQRLNNMPSNGNNMNYGGNSLVVAQVLLRELVLVVEEQEIVILVVELVNTGKKLGSIREILTRRK